MSLSLGIVTGSMSRNAGGLFNSVRESALNLAEAGAEVCVYALEDQHSTLDLPEWSPIVPHVLPTTFRGVFPYARSLDRELARADHDVLHLHGIWQLQSRSVNRWKRAMGRPVMISPRGMLDPWALANSGWKKKLVGAWFEDRNLREADCMHALNSSEARSMRAFGLTNPIAIIPNATHLAKIGPREKKVGRKTLLFLGRIHPKKGLLELVEAWALAMTNRPGLANEWQLEIAGWDDGGHASALETQVARAGLGSSVRLSGPAFGEEKVALLSRADAFVLPSFSEGLPMSVLEAWAYRLPVLMTESCNLPEGFSARAAVKIPTDPAQLAEALIDTLPRKDLQQIGEKGCALVEERFSWSRIAEQHMDVYRWMLGERDAPACVEFARA